MYWPDTKTGVDVEPARKPVASAVRKFFTEGGQGQAPTVPGGDWFNQITNELLNILAAAGIDPSKNDDDQLLQAIHNISKAKSAREALRRSYADAGLNLVDGSFELGGTVANLNDVLLFEAEGQAYSWGGDLPKTVLKNSTPASSGGVGAGAWSDKSNAFPIVNVRHFGVIGGGVKDDTAAAMAAHTFANSLGVPVSYSGISKIAIQANAQIPIKTNTDFCGAELVLLGGVSGSPSFSAFNTAYIISDDACPLQTVTGAVAAANLNAGSLFPTLGLFDGHGYAKITCGLQVPNRAKTGTQSYTQSFKVNRNVTVHPDGIDRKK